MKYEHIYDIIVLVLVSAQIVKYWLISFVSLMMLYDIGAFYDLHYSISTAPLFAVLGTADITPWDAVQ